MDMLHSVVVQNQDPAADTTAVHDLPTNPLSVLLIAIRPLNDTGTLTNFQSYLGLCGALNNVTVRHNGVALVNGSGRDLAALNYFRRGIMPLQNNHGQTNNDRRCAVLPIILGRYPYDPSSCFPASRRGQLTLELDFDVADTGYDDLQYTVEAIEILDARPKEFEKQVSRSLTFGATGDQDFDLPLGNLLRGVLLFGTTAFTGGSPAPSWGRISLLVENQEHSFASTDFEVAHMLGALVGRQPPAFDTHVHVENTACAYAQNAVTGGMVADVGSGGWENYCFLDLDPTGDDTFSVDLGGVTEARIQANVETADAVRCIPIERVAV